MSIKPIYKEDFTFCPPLPGKPNPKKSYNDTAPLAERVVQSGQKKNTCLYYALNFIRHRIGKNPTESQQEAREVERMVSERRKNQTQLQEIWFLYQAFASDLTKAQSSRTFGKNEAEDFVKKNLSKIEKDYRKPFLILMSLFRKQTEYTDLLTFTHETYAKKMMEIDRSFLDKAKVSYRSSVSLEELIKGDTKGTILTKYSEQAGRWQALTRITNQAIFKLYHLQKSSWHPDSPIDCLILHLRNYGPHVVAGTIGQAYYQEDAVVVGKVGKKNIYGWKAGAKKNELSDYHFVALVGAKKVTNGNKKDLVYYVDPIDDSDPNDKDAPKVYVVSYERFREMLSSLDTAKVRDPRNGSVDFFPRQDGENNYALYRPAITSLSSNSSGASSSSSSSSSSTSSCIIKDV